MRTSRIICGLVGLLLPLIFAIRCDEDSKTLQSTVQKNDKLFSNLHIPPTGTFHLYKFSYHSESEVDLNKLLSMDSQSNNQQKLDITIEGNLETTVVEPTPLQIVYKIKDFVTQVVVNGQRAEYLENHLAIIFDNGINATINKQGRLLDFDVQGSDDIYALKIVHSLLTETLITKPESDKKSWQTEENDSLGTYLASYKVITNSGTVQLHKEKIQYNNHNFRGEGDFPIENINFDINSLTKISMSESFFTARTIDKNEDIKYLKGQESFGFNNLQFSLSQQASKKLEKSEVESLKLVFHSKQKSGFTYSNRIQNAKNDETARQAMISLKGRDLEDISDDLRSLLSVDEDLRDDKSHQLFMDIEALITVYPDKAVFIGDLIQEFGVNDLRGNIAMRALMMQGGTAAQATLRHLVDANRSNQEYMEQLLPALALLQKPESESINTLVEFLDANNSEIKYTARLSLGVAANKVLKNKIDDTDNQDRVLNILTDYYDNSSNLTEKRLLLASLGNTGDPRVLKIAEPIIVSKDSNLQLEAINAIRLVESPKATRILLDLITNPDPPVQLAAVQALGYHYIEPNSLDYEVNLWKNTENESIQLKWLERMNKFYLFRPEKTRIFFEYVATSSKYTSTRDYAKSILLGLDSV